MGCLFIALSVCINIVYVGFEWNIVPVGARELRLEGQGLEDITAIRRLGRLEYVDLSDNAISDVSAMKDLKRLDYADLTGNPVSDASGTAVREAQPQALILSSARDATTTSLSLYGRDLPPFEALVSALSAYQNLEQCDLRGAALTDEQVRYLKQTFPNTRFLTVASEGDGAVVQVTSVDDAGEMLERFPDKKVMTLTGTTLSPEEYRALSEAHPDVDIVCQIRLYGRSWPTDAAWVDMSECEIDENLLDYLRIFRHMNSLKLPEMDPVTALSIMQARADLKITYLINGVTISDETTELDIRGMGAPDVNYVQALHQTAPALTRLRVDDLNEQQRASLAALETGIGIVYNVQMLDLKFSTEAQVIDFGDRVVTDEEALQLETIFPYMLNLEYVNMFEATLSQETMDHLFDTYRDIKFGWTFTMVNGTWKVRSDVTAFSTLKTMNSRRYEKEYFRNLRFCYQLMALDLGHNLIDDISWLSYFPHMRILILADNKITDFSVLADLKELEYVELFINEMPDFECLRDHTHIVDLNISYCLTSGATAGPDISPLLTCTSIERLWVSHDKLTGEQISQLHEAFPNAEIVTRGESTGNGWREHDRYYVMINIFRSRIYRSLDDPTKAPDAPGVEVIY